MKNLLENVITCTNAKTYCNIISNNIELEKKFCETLLAQIIYRIYLLRNFQLSDVKA